MTKELSWMNASNSKQKNNLNKYVSKYIGYSFRHDNTYISVNAVIIDSDIGLIENSKTIEHAFDNAVWKFHNFHQASLCESQDVLWMTEKNLNNSFCVFVIIRMWNTNYLSAFLWWTVLVVMVNLSLQHQTLPRRELHWMIVVHRNAAARFQKIGRSVNIKGCQGRKSPGRGGEVVE